MNCETCGKVSDLIGSQGLGHTVRRWRNCKNCGIKFCTYEIPEKQLENAREFAVILDQG